MQFDLLNIANSQRILSQISFSLGLAGFAVGFLVGYGILTGDAQGRVNLLFLLMLFAFLPVVGLILSLAFILMRGRKGLAGWILELPLLPQRLSAEIVKLDISGNRKTWLFYQTQLLTLSFAGGGLLVYLLLLIGSDISFVWRSTLLQAPDLLPVLNVLALPWSFWSDAQPSLDLLVQTRDFRLSAQASDAPALGLWWKYILAAQFTYNILPRSIMLLISRHRYLQALRVKQRASSLGTEPAKPGHRLDPDWSLAPVVYSVTSPYMVLDWANSPNFCHQHLSKILGSPSQILPIEPLPLPSGTEGSSQNTTTVVLVKSWEPPLGELRDYLTSLSDPSQKYILPLDWGETSVKPIKDIHLQEWRRFCHTLDGWQLLQLEDSP
ncbi:MAG: DUF2868 domain-containing protein [Gammaproteobacteria bacterium]|jgi:hypothetical protein|nr:DUF2868 domain-containing protein [Gammaproteobacteria bacterium]MDP6731569.1 DUF2868 domain-containing protein [Gammaproteobacteria bacterium]|tara:strand:- start:809 stop:1951 length:1143 start_codon:yes stop_codon:yes gene_type:complete